jgi:hypothetical protein
MDEPWPAMMSPSLKKWRPVNGAAQFHCPVAWAKSW